MTNVLVACRTTVENPYVSQLVRGLSEHSQVNRATQSLQSFWMGPSAFDILHLQWPEALFRWQEPSEWELGYLSDKLVEWARQSLIITTVHNILPHEHTGRSARQLYETVYEHSDGIIHLGETSKTEFNRHFNHSGGQQHRVIPHGNYSCFPNTVPQSEAREELGLEDSDTVCLAFGALRGFEEVELLINGFNAWNQTSKKLIIAGRLPWPEQRNRQWLFLKWNAMKRSVQFHQGWIPDEKVQIYLNSADVVVIPRIDSLNSGNVALGFTFGRVVVGPIGGVIGEQLRGAENPTYDPRSYASLASALDEAVELVKRNHGERNQRVAQERWNWSNVAEDHVDFYHHVRDA